MDAATDEWGIRVERVEVSEKHFCQNTLCILYVSSKPPGDTSYVLCYNLSLDGSGHHKYLVVGNTQYEETLVAQLDNV